MIVGNFRGSKTFHDPCKPCNCHGHGDTCDPETGDNCNCKNNTENDICGGSPSNKNSVTPCYMVQCSKCKEGYLGTPKDGHQCYKQLTVDSKMCFDAKPIGKSISYVLISQSSFCFPSRIFILNIKFIVRNK